MQYFYGILQDPTKNNQSQNVLDHEVCLARFLQELRCLQDSCKKNKIFARIFEDYVFLAIILEDMYFYSSRVLYRTKLTNFWEKSLRLKFQAKKNKKYEWKAQKNELAKQDSGRNT